MSSPEVESAIPKAPTIDYAMDEAGKITRTDKDSITHVATYDAATKVLRLVPEWARFRAPVVRWINEQDIGIESVILEGDKPDKVSSDIPPPPKKLMQFGDKTPALVEWYKKYKPAEYRARYGVRGPGTVTKTRKIMDPVTGRPTTETYHVEATIAERKTHLTEKPDASDQGTGEYADA